jgi:copper chaperone NosL
MRLARTLLIIGVLCWAPLGFAQEDIQKHRSCAYCGMDRKSFGHSRMFVEYSDGASVGTCSIRCIVLDLTQNLTKVPCSLKVGDYQTRKLIDADKAFWVVGGNKRGVMTRKAKWAFEKESSAKDFISSYGGDPATFHEALKAAYEEIYEEVKDTLEMAEERKARGSSPCKPPSR